ncbi:MAG: hypothetical protein Kow0025_21870 [Thermodesulfovibrionales bacterium]
MKTGMKGIGRRGAGGKRPLVRRPWAAAAAVLCALALLFALRPAEALAAEGGCRFPEVAPSLSLKGGFRSVGLEGSGRAAEFEDLGDSPWATGEMVAFPFPHRVHLDLEYLSENDFFGDLSYAYRDVVLSRVINRTLFHNLDNFRLVDLEPSGPPPFPAASPWIESPEVSSGGPAVDFGVKDQMTTYFLRLKAPSYPFHIYADGQVIDKEGDVQQRFLGGSGFFNRISRSSERREIDWLAREVTVGANSHLGPVEVDVSHGEKRFDSKGAQPVSSFSEAVYISDVVRPAGDYPHNVTADLRGSTNVLKVHTSYTGRVVASATLSETDRENDLSGARAERFMGAGEVRWLPAADLALVVRYRHHESEAHNPSSLADGYYGLSTNPTAIADIRPSLSTRVDRVSGDVRYRALKGLTLFLNYTYRETSRENAGLWGVPAATTENEASVAASARPMRTLRLRARYRHLEVDNPAYNTRPDRSDSGQASLTWTPVPRVTAFVSYSVTDEERDSPFLTTEAEGRDADYHRLRGSLSFAATERLALTASYAYFRNRIRQGIVYGNLDDPDNPFIDTDVPYEDEANNFMVGASYTPRRGLSLGADVSHTVSRGTFSPGLGIMSDPVSVGSLSRLDLRETVYSASASYDLPGGWGVEARYRLSDFENRFENPLDPEVEDGTAHFVLVGLSKTW